MIFKNAFHLLVDNFLLTYKFLLYKIFVGVIVLALSAALVYPTLNMLFSSQPFLDVVTLFNESVDSLSLAGMTLILLAGMAAAVATKRMEAQRESGLSEQKG